MAYKHEQVQKLLDHIVSECTAADLEARFSDVLDECYSFEKVGGPFQYMTPSRVLKEMDPTAFRCGVNDWADGEELYEINGDYYDRADVDKAREEFIEELDSEISDLTESITTAGIEDVARMERDLNELKAGLKAVEEYARYLEGNI